MADVTIGELKGILSLQDNFSGPLNDAAKGIGAFSESFGACTKAAGLAAAAITTTGAAILAMGSHGDQVADVSDAFEGLSKAAGSSADVMLGALRNGVVGTLSDFDLMTVGAKALGGGLISSAKDMETLASGARGLAKATGVETAEAFATLTKAMATGRTAGLANAGLLVDSKAATIEYANSIGVSVGELTKHEKAVAASHAILAALNARFKDKAPADFGEMMEQAKVGVQNFVDKLGVAISQSPVIQVAFKTIGQELQEAFGGKQEAMVASLMKGVNQFAIALTYVAQGALVAATVFVTAWYGVKTAILAVETVIAGLGTGIVGLVSGLAGMAASIPGLGEHVKGFAAGAKELQEHLAGVTVSLADQTAEAARGVVGNSAAQASIDKWGGAVVNLRDVMVKANGETAIAAHGLREFGNAAAETAPLAEAAARKIEEAFIKLRADLDSVGKTSLDRQLIQMEAAYKIELLHLKDLKGATETQVAEMTRLIEERYRKEKIAATASGDEIVKATTKIQNELALLQSTGMKKQILTIDQQRTDDLAGLAKYAQAYGVQYSQLAALVNAKYNEMTKAAKHQYDTAVQYAAANGLQTRAELQHTVDVTLAGYNQMKASGEFTAGQLKEAWSKYLGAVDALEGKHVLTSLEKFNMIASASSSMLKDLFGKNKAAAYAAAIIDTAAAVISSFKNAGGWPWGLIPAAAMLAAGAVQISKISSTDAGFAEGTPGMGYQDFGAATPTVLHGNEAVVTQAQGEGLAGDVMRGVADGLRGRAGSGRTTNINVTNVLNEDPLQTFESRERQREFTLKTVEAAQHRHLSRMVAMGMA
jgi:hypothetical protein